VEETWKMKQISKFAGAGRGVRPTLLALLLWALSGIAALAQSDPLPSWNEGVVKKSITDFVTRVTAHGGADFVPVARRIAIFDNDGTLWTEQPVYFQLAFAFDRVKAMAPQHPEWKTTQPFKGLLDKDMKALAASGEKGLMQVMAATHAGMTTDDFSKAVRDWTASAQGSREALPDAIKLVDASAFYPQSAVVGGWVARTDYYNDNKEILGNIIRAWADANDYIVRNPAAAAEALQKNHYRQASVSDIAEALKAQKMFTSREWRRLYVDGTVAKWLQQVSDFFMTDAGITGAKPASEYFDPDLYLSVI
jgi:hypothetical protein